MPELHRISRVPHHTGDMLESRQVLRAPPLINGVSFEESGLKPNLRFSRPKPSLQDDHRDPSRWKGIADVLQ
ncbi:hypothetical protein AVEN_132527-1 [Araneus ventricosus]|uniref:Uncharacterized protein n=1 Tax=Araneus ventricosus TaxID=182803 RepID=A0A4Y2UBJ5_ARAVE|nr:hypothetical protein AVEN_214769-1 [Araneus ventricosus]GBO09893.1 hypothetical protein AVEN_264410-1 [Araneus ventricosus]GBO11155.1 hypothetical protein AVEN_237565-1 [Araneus ventricosus]GBO11160.1 hypothetical protein AVEN_132527-1 [Araneus ventricosus]